MFQYLYWIISIFCHYIMEGNACPFYNIFHGIIYCATCGKSMQVRYEKVGRTGKTALPAK